ncbi:hypothetical protein ACQE3E_06675 [Methylomonas sp. MED-D]|uniref:hypothetical protein n=1 Tax=Methylomonas sp. MED-D TaxID=3418768 RepID=UPI003CFD5F5B
MINGKSIRALCIPLNTEIDAIFVKDGEEWETLQRYRCIAPADLWGESVIVGLQKSSRFSSMLGTVLNIDGDDEFVVFLASPKLAAELKKIKDRNA